MTQVCRINGCKHNVNRLAMVAAAEPCWNDLPPGVGAKRSSSRRTRSRAGPTAAPRAALAAATLQAERHQQDSIPTPMRNSASRSGPSRLDGPGPARSESTDPYGKRPGPRTSGTSSNGLPYVSIDQLGLISLQTGSRWQPGQAPGHHRLSSTFMDRRSVHLANSDDEPCSTS